MDLEFLQDGRVRPSFRRCAIARRPVVYVPVGLIEQLQVRKQEMFVKGRKTAERENVPCRIQITQHGSWRRGGLGQRCSAEGRFRACRACVTDREGVHVLFQVIHLGGEEAQEGGCRRVWLC